MKRLTLAALVAVLATPAPLLAQDVFVRPNTGTNSGPPAVDYGVKAKPQQQAPVAQPAAQPQTPQPVQPTQPILPSRQAAPQQQPTQYTPPPDFAGTPRGNGLSIKNIGNDLTIIQTPPDPPPPKGKGSGSLSVSFQGGAIGADDKSYLTRNLGMTDQEIQGNCFLRYATMVQYASGQANLVQSGTATTMRYMFNPPLEKITVYPGVACRKLKMPVTGMVLEQQGYYIASLTSVDCPPPPADKANGSVSATFSYLGDGKGQCLYQ